MGCTLVFDPASYLLFITVFEFSITFWVWLVNSIQKVRLETSLLQDYILDDTWDNDTPNGVNGINVNDDDDENYINNNNENCIRIVITIMIIMMVIMITIMIMIMVMRQWWHPGSAFWKIFCLWKSWILWKCADPNLSS